MQVNVLLVDETLVLTEDFNVKEFSLLRDLLADNSKAIKRIDPKCNMSISVLYMLKKHLGEEVNGLPEKYLKQWDSISTTPPEYTKHFDSKYNAWGAISKAWEIFSLDENDSKQNDFWMSRFLKIFLQLTLDNAFIIFVLFVGIGVTITYLTYGTLFDYGFELESVKATVLFGLKIFCPMMSVILVAAKSCTAESSIIKSMSINGDFKVMHIMNLPYKRVYLHPAFVACALSGPLVNLVAILGIIVGSCGSWIAKGNSYQLFFSMLTSEAYMRYILNSELRAFLASFLTGFCMCIAGLVPGKDFQSLISVINTCITLSFISNILAQTIVSLF